jgi:hypothetical protein
MDPPWIAVTQSEQLKWDFSPRAMKRSTAALVSCAASRVLAAALVAVTAATVPKVAARSNASAAAHRIPRVVMPALGRTESNGTYLGGHAEPDSVARPGQTRCPWLVIRAGQHCKRWACSRAPLTAGRHEEGQGRAEFALILALIFLGGHVTRPISKIGSSV